MGALEATLPTFPSIGDSIRGITRAQASNPEPPRIITLAANTPTRVYDTTAAFNATVNGVAVQLPKDIKYVSKLLIHNLGIVGVRVGINSDISNAGAGYHDIIAGGNVANDGLGTQVDFSKDQPAFICLWASVQTDVSIVISYPGDVTK